MSGNSAGSRSARLRAGQSQAKCGVSPELRKRARNPSEDDDTPEPKRMAGVDEDGQKEIMSALNKLNKRFDEVPNHRDISQLEVSIRTRIHENTKEIAKIRATQSEDRAKLPKVVKKIVNEEIALHKSARTGLIALTLDEQVKEKNYLIARRTMRMWPAKLTAEVKSLSAAARTFCIEILKVPADQAEALQIAGVIEAAPSRRGRIKNEIVVTFKTAADRDLVQSFAPNHKELQGKAGVRLDLSLIHI